MSLQQTSRTQSLQQVKDGPDHLMLEVAPVVQQTWQKNNTPKWYVLQPSLASLRDGLPGRAGSQRDEAKMQAPILPRI